MARARRFVWRRVRCVGRAAERRPTASRPASLLLSAHRRAGSTIPHDEDERALSRKRVVPPSSAAGLTDGACSPLRQAPRALCWPRRRALTNAITPNPQLLTAYRRAGSSTRHDDGERAPSREHVVPWSRAADHVERAPIVPSGAACRVGRTAEGRPTPPRPISLLLSAHRRAGSTIPHDEDERALSRERVVPPWSTAGVADDARSSLREAPRAPCVGGRPKSSSC